MEDLKIEDHHEHWKSTLLGIDFWKDAEIHNQPIHDDIEAEQNELICTRFPFNIGPEEGPRSHVPISSERQHVPEEPTPDEEQSKPKPRRRRFSMNDAFSLSSLSLTTSRALHSNRLVDLGRRARSRSREPSTRAASENRSNSFRWFSLAMMGYGKRSSSANCRDKAGDIDDDSGRGSGRKQTENQASIQSVLSIRSPQEPGTPAKPLMYFRGGASWNCLPRDMQAIGIDVFWPVKNNQVGMSDRREVLHIEELAPLCQFRGLRVLKLTGMLQSYQKYIWQAAWLNTELEELELGMALAPRIRRNYQGKWPLIKGGWTISGDSYGEPVYHGHMGSGTLKRSIGVGEYLDKTAIEKAKVCATANGRTLNRLSIKTLTLNGFVVDADPFLLWFDPKRLRCINFQDNCVDAGFYLCLPMKRVNVRYPLDINEKALTVRRVDVKKELKVVELKGGKKIGEAPYRGKETLEEDITGKGSKEDSKEDHDVFAQRIGDMKLDNRVSDPAGTDDKKDTVVQVRREDDIHDSTDSDEDVDDNVDTLDDHDAHVYRHEMF